MKPDVSQVMQKSFEKLVLEIAPALGEEYAVGSASVIGLMMFMTGAEFERAAEVRVRDNEALRSLFAGAARQVEEGSLKARLQDAASGQDDSLLVSDLECSADFLKALLIDLQVYVEQMDTDWARTIESQAWTFLCESTQRRKLPYPDF